MVSNIAAQVGRPSRMCQRSQQDAAHRENVKASTLSDQALNIPADGTGNVATLQMAQGSVQCDCPVSISTNLVRRQPANYKLEALQKLKLPYQLFCVHTSG